MPNTPEQSDKYDGPQSLTSSDRIVINAKKDHLLLSAAQTIYVGGKKGIRITTEQTASIKAKSIYLGSRQFEPALLGDKTHQVLSKIVDQMLIVADAMVQATGTPPGVNIPSFLVAGSRIKTAMNRIKLDLEKIRSTVVKLE